MTQTKSEIYNAFARMIYAVVIADGVIDNDEKDIMREKCKGHAIYPYLQDYINSDEKVMIIESYQNLLNVCREHGEDEEYPFLVGLLDEFKLVSGVLDEDEIEILDSIIQKLKSKLKIS